MRPQHRAPAKVKAPWDRVLEKTRRTGTATGTQVASTLRDYAKRAQTTIREQRETGFKTAHLLIRNFAILASGILIGTSEGLGAKPAAARRKAGAVTGRKIAKTAKRKRATSGKRIAATSARRPKTAQRARTHGGWRTL